MTNTNQLDEFTPLVVVDHGNTTKGEGVTKLMMITTTTINSSIPKSIIDIGIGSNYYSSIEYCVESKYQTPPPPLAQFNKIK